MRLMHAAVLTGCISPFQQNEDTLPMAYEMPLQFDEFDLQVAKRRLVACPRQRATFSRVPFAHGINDSAPDAGPAKGNVISFGFSYVRSTMCFIFEA